MSTDSDFSKVQLKCNTAGSWLNVCKFDTNDYDRIKTACVVLSECAVGRIKFKLMDADGGEIETLQRDNRGQPVWVRSGAKS